MATPAGVRHSLRVRAGLQPLGVIPFDNLVLPVPSPDGRFVATQTGVPPTWETILAEPGAEPPLETRIEIYELDRRELPGEQQRERHHPTLTATLNEAAVLGRSADAAGFLIESPRADGSRWIGKVAWSTGELRWLVSDAAVNAFAALGPNGRLAWSRRAAEASDWELVVRGASDEDWTFGIAGSSWLMPAWAGRGDRLFALSLTGGALEARYGVASSFNAFRQSLQRVKILPADATVFTAYQTRAGQAALSDVNGPATDAFFYFHPALDRLALWRPAAASGNKVMMLNAGSLAGVLHDGGLALVGAGSNLVLQSLGDLESNVELIAGVYLPQPSALQQWPYTLLSPGDGVVGVMGLRLLPLE